MATEDEGTCSRTVWRPYDRSYLRQTLGLRPQPPSGQGSESDYEPQTMSPPLTRVALLLEAVRTTALSGSIGLARFGFAQGEARLRFLADGTPEHRNWLASAAREVWRAGGLIDFLGFEDPAYVGRLAQVADSMTDGPSLLEFLIRQRVDSGRIWDGERLPIDFQSTASG